MMNVVALCQLVVWVPVAILLATSRATGAETLHPVEECPKSEPACVLMDLNLIWPGEQSGDLARHPIVIAEKYFESRFIPHFLLGVTGRLNGSEPKQFQLFLRQNTGDLQCSDFVAAAVGLSANQGGIILTDKGILELVDMPLQLGCSHCVALINKEDLKVSYKISRSWDQGMWNGRFVFQENGDVYWKTEAACIDATSPGRFKAVDSERCVGPDLAQADARAVKRVRDAGVFDGEYVNERLEYDLYELKDAPFFVYVWGVACT